MFLMLIIFVILIAFIGFIILLPIAAIKNSKIKPTNCPSCGREVKLVNDNQKCPKCRTKLFKHGDGEYRIRT